MPEINSSTTIKSFARLGQWMKTFAEQDGPEAKNETAFQEPLSKACQKNPWFTKDNVLHSFSAWADVLTEAKLDKWLQPYKQQLAEPFIPKTIGVINAGNIPLVGFHDFLCVILSGNKYLGKNSSNDPYLLPFVTDKLIEIEPALNQRIAYSERFSVFDAVIATGSNNSARYFDYYFGKYPNIIRMSRHGVAVLTGRENSEDFQHLGEDIFSYFGLGCRNISKIFIPRNFDISNFYEGIESFSTVAQHHKYMNNVEYNNAIFLLKKIDFLTNNFLILKEDAAITSPVGVLYYEYYDDLNSLRKKLESEKEQIQCIIGKEFIPFGKAQQPDLCDYADGVDTMNFLLNLQN